jgi:hypothetical protein
LGEQIDIPDHRFPKRKSLNNIYFEKQAFWMYGLKNSRPLHRFSEGIFRTFRRFASASLFTKQGDSPL